MKFRCHNSSLLLLSRLWLHEPDAATVARAVSELGLPSAEPEELASAYVDVLVLNVIPYGTVFTDASGELNALAAQQLAGLYEAHGYQPPELNAVGAPDHLGLCLGFLAHLPGGAPGHTEFLARLVEWAPVCCLAVEREPTAPAFYRALARATRECLLSRLSVHGSPPKAAPAQTEFDLDCTGVEIGLPDILQFLLAPARCGTFFSRSRLGQVARALGVRLPFGSRFEVAETLFASASEAEEVRERLAALGAEVDAWAQAYQAWVEEQPAWQPNAALWLERTTRAASSLAQMRAMAGTQLA